MSVHPYLDLPGPVGIAHRGGGGARRENTIEAFADAVSLGYCYLETDARVTADGVAVAFHDATLLRMTGEPRALRALTWADVCTLRIDGSCAIPQLAEVLDGFPGTRFAVDVKERGVVSAVAASVSRTASLDRVCLGSFSAPRLSGTLALLGPAACSSLPPGGVADLLRAAARGRVYQTTAQVAALPARFAGIAVSTRTVVETAHRSGLVVHAWTVNHATEMHRLLAAGVDGIISDELVVLRSVLDRWVS